MANPNMEMTAADTDVLTSSLSPPRPPNIFATAMVLLLLLLLPA
jgi:hypothetical protein